MTCYLFTSESVSEGHPDKVCDQISDAVLDKMLEQDKHSRVACETLVTTGQVIIAGEVTTKAKLEIAEIARSTIREIGYDDPGIGFDADSCGVLVSLHAQSIDISQGVNKGEGLYKEQGAGDQGIMFGYATEETPEKMPATLQFSHALLKKMAAIRKAGRATWMRPDSKSQVTIEYENHKPKRVHTIVISTQHSQEIGLDDIKSFLVDNVIKEVIPEDLLDERTIYHVNPTGQFIIGGPHGDAGLTGRKIIVDTYGGWGAHGGGAFSGKDPSKVDRSAAYMARYIAKNMVAAGAASRCLVQLSYAIGVPDPISIFVNSYGTGHVSDAKLVDIIHKEFSCKPSDIIDAFDLLRPLYRETARYGHFGRDDLDLPWEKTDRSEKIKSML